MQLRIARLCLDCEDVHDGPQCPVCASEAFVFLTRWVPAPEGRFRPKPTPAPDLEVYREITAAEPPPPKPGSRVVLRGLMGLGVVGGVLGAVFGAAGRRSQRQSKESASSGPRTRPPGRPADD